MLCIICCLSCACCNWPLDLDSFAGGMFSGLKIPFFNDLFKGLGSVFKTITNPFGEIGKLFKI
jgi:hypothetical protein